MTGKFRTDLACEQRESLGAGELAGVRAAAYTERGCEIESVEILDERGAEALCKPIGKYLTLSTQTLTRREPESFENCAAELAALLRSLLPRPGELTLVAGLGNAVMTPDAVGPLAAEYVLATRHLKSAMPEDFAGLAPVCVARPGVLGSTGIESAELLNSLCERVKPAQVIALDALAAASLSRLCSTVQLTDAGIVPGSGVGNNRAALTRATLGLPVLAIGVPTVVDLAMFSDDEGAKGMFVTPRDIDDSVRSLSKLLGYAVNLALHEGLSIADIDLLKG